MILQKLEKHEYLLGGTVTVILKVCFVLFAWVDTFPQLYPVDAETERDALIIPKKDALMLASTLALTDIDSDASLDQVVPISY